MEFYRKRKLFQVHISASNHHSSPFFLTWCCHFNEAFFFVVEQFRHQRVNLKTERKKKQKNKQSWDSKKSFHRNTQIDKFPLSPNYTVNNIIYTNRPMDIETLNQYNWQTSLSWWGKGTTRFLRKKAWEEKAHSNLLLYNNLQ